MSRLSRWYPVPPFIAPKAATAGPSGLYVENTSPGAVRDSNATTQITYTPGDMRLLVAFCHGDAGTGATNEALTVTSTGGLTWQRGWFINGAPGAVVEVWFTKVWTSPGTITVSVTDNQGSVPKSVFLRSFGHTSGLMPSLGVAGFSSASAVSLVTTVPAAWVWSLGIGQSSASSTPGAGDVSQDGVLSGGFDGGDNIWTYSKTVTTPAAGTSVTVTNSAPPTVYHHLAVEIIPPVSGVPAVCTRPPARPSVRTVRARPVPFPPAGAAGPPPSTAVPRVVAGPQRHPVRPVRARLVVAPPAQAVAPVPAPPLVVAPVRRRWPSRRGRLVEPVWAPPATVLPVVRAVRRLAVLVRRGRLVGPALTSYPVGVPVPAVTAGRRRVLPWRRGRLVAVPAAPAAVVSAPAPAVVRPPVRVRPVPRGRVLGVPVALPPVLAVVVRARVWWRLPRRPRVADTAPFVPAFTGVYRGQVHQRARVRWPSVRPRRVDRPWVGAAPSVGVPQPQVVQRRVRLSWPSRRGRYVAPVTPGAAAAAGAGYPGQVVARRWWAPRWRRALVAGPVPAAAAPVPVPAPVVSAPVRRRTVSTRRGRVMDGWATSYRPGVWPPAPTVGRRRVLPWRRGRLVGAPVVPPLPRPAPVHQSVPARRPRPWRRGRVMWAPVQIPKTVGWIPQEIRPIPRLWLSLWRLLPGHHGQHVAPPWPFVPIQLGSMSATDVPTGGVRPQDVAAQAAARDLATGSATAAGTSGGIQASDSAMGSVSGRSQP